MNSGTRDPVPPLPRPDIVVTPTPDQGGANPPGSVDIMISRDGKGRSYRTVGGTNAEVMKDGLDKVLGDSYSGEWIEK